LWKKIVLTGVIGIVSLYGLFEIGYYATSSPAFCGSCHEIKEYKSSWQVSVHKNINCLECHQPRGELGKIQAKARGLNYVFQHFSGDYTIPTQAVISDQNCIQCHVGDSRAYPNAVRLTNSVKVNHYEMIKNAQSCLACHREVGHATDIYLKPDLKGIR